LDLSKHQLIRLEEETLIRPFDCQDDDLNDFLFNDAKAYSSKLLAVTYLLEELEAAGRTAAFFCVSNDKIAMEDMDDEKQWKKVKKSMPRNKQFRSYPAVKIGRLGVDINMQKSGIGTTLLDYIKQSFITNNKTGCMFITVDAYNKSTSFYEKNGFKFLCPNRDKEKAGSTKLMYYDLRELK